MTVVIGNLSVALAGVVCVLAAVLAMASAVTRSPGLMTGVRAAFAVHLALLLASSWALLTAILGSDFTIAYVASYTERALPFGYKLAAFWAGQEGSLLLWALLIAAMSCLHVWTRRKSGTEGAAEAVTLAVVSAFFAALLLIAANPFKVSEVEMMDGHGLNPLLQDWAMIAHPPILFLGYAGYTIPFAMMVGALIAGRRDNVWVLETRRWVVASWLFLGVGIILGSLWAYYELGWGGYWGWDPVENGSLAPWLVGTALLHSIMVQQQRGMLKVWNAFLYAATFALCIFATILTRGGFVESVHGFGQSLTASFFLVFWLALLLAAAVLIIVRVRLLRSERELEELLGRETMLLATNIVLVVMAGLILGLTVFPALTNLLSGSQLTIKRDVYDKLIGPMGLLLVAMMAVGPLLSYGAGASQRFLRGLVFPVIGAVAAMIILVVLGIRNVWAVASGGIAALALLSIAVDLVRSLAARVKAGENIVFASIRLLDGNHRRYGGQLVHVGMMMMVIGIVGSGLFGEKQDISLKAGESAQFAGATITYDKLAEVRGPNYTAVDATIRVTDSAGRTINLHPQRRHYDKSEQPNSEIAIDWNWRRDIYVTLAGWDDAGAVVAIQAILNPLVLWIWIGGIVLTLGGLLCLLPRVFPQPGLIPTDQATQVVEPAAGQMNRPGVAGTRT